MASGGDLGHCGEGRTRQDLDSYAMFGTARAWAICAAYDREVTSVLQSFAKESKTFKEEKRRRGDVVSRRPTDLHRLPYEVVACLGEFDVAVERDKDRLLCDFGRPPKLGSLLECFLV